MSVSHLFLLLLVVFSASKSPSVEATDDNATTSSSSNTSSTLVSVECPANQTTFTALTEMVLVGRSTMLRQEELLALNNEFVGVYNGLTESNCDSLFRRVQRLTFVNMTNDLGEVNLIGASGGSGNIDRNLQATTAVPTTIDLNASVATPPTRGDISVFYEIEGTCRECPVTRTGSLDLYDEGIRRNLLLLRQTNNINDVRFRTLAITSVTTRQLQNDNDCQCLQGTLPEEPRAPGVQECVDEMNVQFDSLRENRGLFENVSMSDLIQTDDLSELEVEAEVEVEVEETIVSTNTTTEEVNGDSNTVEVSIWGRGGDELDDVPKTENEDESSSTFSASSTATSMIGSSGAFSPVRASAAAALFGYLLL